MKKFCFLTLIMLICLTGCGKAAKPESLRMAVFDRSKVSNQLIEEYEKRTGIPIEIVEYERDSDEAIDGIDLLKRDIVSGKGPDIINFGWGFTMTDVLGKYTEDLSEYLAREDLSLLDNVVGAFELEGELPVIPTGFDIVSMIGDKKFFGERNTVTMQELMEIYEANKADGVMLYVGQFKIEVMAELLVHNLGNFIDWDTGICSFDSEEFKDVLQFANMFSAEYEYPDGISIRKTYLNEKAMLAPLGVSNVYDIAYVDYVYPDYKGKIIGYPTDKTSGSIIEPGYVNLAIPKTTKKKEQAWDFIQFSLEYDSQKLVSEDYLPLNKDVIKERIEEYKKPHYDDSGEMIAVRQLGYEEDGHTPVYVIDEKQGNELWELVNSVDSFGGIDWKIYQIIFEEVQPYFEGAKDLDVVCDIIQKRVSVYVQERKG